MDIILQLGSLFVTAFVVGLSGAMMPGPLLAVTINESVRRGPWAGPLIVVGHAILEVALVAAVALGLTTFLKNEMVIAVISLAGGAVMGWMGQDMVRSARTLSLDLKTYGRKAMHPVAAGIVVSLSNPYWTLWWATIGIAYVLMGLEFGWVGIVVFFAGHILADFVWYTAVSVAMARGRNLLSDRTYRGLIMFCGAALILFGAWFLWTGLTTLRT